MNRNYSGFVVITFCVITWVGVQHLGYIEFGIAGRMFVEGAFRRLLNSQITLQSYEGRLLAAATPDDCWTVIQAASKDFGFHCIHMKFAGRTFDWHNGVHPLNSWEVTVPISDEDYVRLIRSFGAGGQPNVIAPFADTLRRTLAPKLPVFSAAHRYLVAGQGN